MDSSRQIVNSVNLSPIPRFYEAFGTNRLKNHMRRVNQKMMTQMFGELANDRLAI
jgi:hypothetical protein